MDIDPIAFFLNCWEFQARVMHQDPDGTHDNLSFLDSIGMSRGIDAFRVEDGAISPFPRPARWRLRSSVLRARALCTLVALEVLCIATGFGIAASVRGVFFADTNWLFVLAILVPINLTIGSHLRIYSPADQQDPIAVSIRSVQALLLSVCMVVFIAFCLKTSASFPRVVVLIGSGLAVAFVGVLRYVFARHMARMIGGNPYTVVLLRDGDGPVPDGTFSCVMTADAFDPYLHDPVMYDRLGKMLATADRVVVACPPERRAAWAHALKGAHIQSEIFVPELDTLAPLGLAYHSGVPTLIIANGPLRVSDRVVKRGFDTIIALIALIVLVPLFATVALVIKLDTPGPILFRQTRIGRGNRMFRMMKFRSMRVEDADGAGHRSTARSDDRITRSGAFIRRTSIDELPQLLNVLKGDMSIVGPRPHALGSRAADKLFWEVDGRYWHRHATKPGLTGLAQVRGYRGATMIEDDLRNRLQADLEYLERWSIWRDLRIILMTFRVLLHRNAF